MPWQPQAVEPSSRVDAALRSIAAALPAGRMTVSARQDRNRGELLPSWTMQISGPLSGTEFSIELAGPILGQLLEDAIEALVTLGIDIQEPDQPDQPDQPDEPGEPDEPDAKYTPVDASDPASYPG